MAIHMGTGACAGKPGSAVSRKHKFYFSCQSYGVHSRACEVYVWEDELEEYVQKRIRAAGVKLQELREDRDEFIEELSDRTREIKKLKRMNKFAGIIINKVEQFSNKCRTVVQEASRKGARLNTKHAMGWEEIVQNTNDVIVEESSRIIANINQITDAMREIKKTTNYTTDSDGIQEDKETPLSIEPVEGDSPNVHTQPRSILGMKRKKVTTSKRHTPKRARVDISDESEGAQEAAHKAIDDFLEAANDFSMAHSDGIGNDTTQLAVQKGNKPMCSAQPGHGPHNVEEKEMDNMEENQLSIVPVRNQNDEGVGGTIDPADMHSKFKVALTSFRKTDLMSAFTAASSSTANATPCSIGTKGGVNEGLGMQLVRTPAPNQLLVGSTSRTSPVSLHRQMCAVELDIREEIEEGAINLNIVLPVKFDFKWSTYIWDFPKAKIFVLDPTMNNGDESDKDIQRRHQKVADELHKAIELCIKSFFAGWEPDMRLWNTCFPKSLVTGICKKY
ncbi:hypothetical protein ZWY2020_028518 [Hordeum vulgare]|nr:hypothetical protein ZWY2020_028518 [Hordeum vulgare]